MLSDGQFSTSANTASAADGRPAPPVLELHGPQPVTHAGRTGWIASLRSR